jgi:hypothetical protein
MGCKFVALRAIGRSHVGAASAEHYAAQFAGQRPQGHLQVRKESNGSNDTNGNLLVVSTYL